MSSRSNDPSVREVDRQVDVLCGHKFMDGPLRGQLLRHLIKVHRKGIVRDGRRLTGREILFDFYKERGEIHPLELENEWSKESEGKALVRDLAAALTKYYAHLPTGAPDRVEIRITTGRGSAYRPDIRWRSAPASSRAEVSPSIPPAEDHALQLFSGPHVDRDLDGKPSPAIIAQPPDSTGQPSLLRWFRRKFHRYHLTLDPHGSPAWFYTVLDFTNGGQEGGVLSTQTLQRPHEEDDAADHTYEWRAAAFGRHVVLRGWRPQLDVALELFPIKPSFSKQVAGVRINDTLHSQTVASSIVLLCRTPPPGLENLPVGLVSRPEHVDVLEKTWEHSNNAVIQRLPRPAGVHRQPEPAPDPLVTAFWHDYLNGPGITQIAYGTPEFTEETDRDGLGKTYTRTIWKNRALQEEARKKRKKVTGKAVFSFVAHGDVDCAMTLMQWLSLRRVNVQFSEHYPESTLTGLEEKIGRANATQANLILIGSTRSNGLISRYEELAEMPFRSDDFSVFKVPGGNGARGGKQQPSRWTLKSGKTRDIVPVLITRCPGERGGVVTCISATSSRVVKRVGEVLTSEAALSEFIGRAKLGRWRHSLPKRFQIVLTVDVLLGRRTFEGDYDVVAVFP